MRGDLKKDFAVKVNKIIEDTLNNYDFEIGVAIGPAKLTIKPVSKYSHQSLENER